MKKALMTMGVSMLLVFMLAFAALKETSYPVNAADKIEPALTEKMQRMHSDERIAVDIWLTEIDTGLVDELMADKMKKLEGRYDPGSAEYIDFQIEARRAIYASIEEPKNWAFVERFPNIDSLHSETAYISKYSPVISAELTAEEILLLSEDKEVRGVFVFQDLEVEDEFDISVQTVRATYTRDTMSLKGGNIKIGMFESGMPDRNSGLFNASSIHYETDDNSAVTYSHSDHADMVAYIICGVQKTYGGVTYQGIVPNAELYSTRKMGVWHERIEWLLSKGVNVINMSSKLPPVEVRTYSPGFYSSLELWLDHIGINHSVHFVKSAGNTGGAITPPGMAYNIVTVGAIDDNGTADTWGADDIRANFSAYTQVAYEPNKPDIMAPGANIGFPFTFEINGVTTNVSSGTSFAAPHVTAIIAQMCQARPYLKQKQACMKAVLAAGTTHSLSCQTGDPAMEEIGAGVVDARGAYYVVSNDRYVAANFPAATVAETTVQYQFSVSSSDAIVRVALSWLANVSFSSSNHSGLPLGVRLANLDLKVKDPNGNPL